LQFDVVHGHEHLRIHTEELEASNPRSSAKAHIDVRGRNPMVVEEDCPGTCE
jgi:hypothetical protein